MASIVPRPRGQYWVQFRHNRKRYTVRLGKTSKRASEQFKENLEELLLVVGPGVRPSGEVIAWLGRMADGPYGSLVTAGLVEPREEQGAEERCEAVATVHDLKLLCRKIAKERLRDGEIKQATFNNIRYTTESMLRFWGGDYPLRDITPRRGDRREHDGQPQEDGKSAQEFRRWLADCGRKKGGTLKETTVSRRCRRVREFFDEAIEERYVDKNPFRRMRKWSERSVGRDHYVTIDAIESGIEATYDLELRLLMAYARYCGIRGPSELEQLRISDFDLERATVRIISPKTDHHEGHEMRWIPLWPALERRFLDFMEVVPDGTELAFPNLSQLSGTAIVKRANSALVAGGVKPFPRFFVNCRASCDEDLFEVHPQRKVEKWLGHSAKVASEHYSRYRQRQDAHGVEAPEPEWCQLPFTRPSRPESPGCASPPPKEGVPG